MIASGNQEKDVENNVENSDGVPRDGAGGISRAAKECQQEVDGAHPQVRRQASSYDKHKPRGKTNKFAETKLVNAYVEHLLVSGRSEEAAEQGGKKIFLRAYGYRTYHKKYREVIAPVGLHSGATSLQNRLEEAIARKENSNSEEEQKEAILLKKVRQRPGGKPPAGAEYAPLVPESCKEATGDSDLPHYCLANRPAVGAPLQEPMEFYAVIDRVLHEWCSQHRDLSFEQAKALINIAAQSSLEKPVDVTKKSRNWYVGILQRLNFRVGKSGTGMKKKSLTNISRYLSADREHCSLFKQRLRNIAKHASSFILEDAEHGRLIRQEKLQILLHCGLLKVPAELELNISNATLAKDDDDDGPAAASSSSTSTPTSTSSAAGVEGGSSSVDSSPAGSAEPPATPARQSTEGDRGQKRERSQSPPRRNTRSRRAHRNAGSGVSEAGRSLSALLWRQALGETLEQRPAVDSSSDNMEDDEAPESPDDSNLMQKLVAEYLDEAWREEGYDASKVVDDFMKLCYLAEHFEGDDRYYKALDHLEQQRKELEAGWQQAKGDSQKPYLELLQKHGVPEACIAGRVIVNDETYPKNTWKKNAQGAEVVPEGQRGSNSRSGGGSNVGGEASFWGLANGAFMACCLVTKKPLPKKQRDAMQARFPALWFEVSDSGKADGKLYSKQIKHIEAELRLRDVTYGGVTEEQAEKRRYVDLADQCGSHQTDEVRVAFSRSGIEAWGLLSNTSAYASTLDALINASVHQINRSLVAAFVLKHVGKLPNYNTSMDFFIDSLSRAFPEAQKKSFYWDRFGTTRLGYASSKFVGLFPYNERVIDQRFADFREAYGDFPAYDDFATILYEKSESLRNAAADYIDARSGKAADEVAPQLVTLREEERAYKQYIAEVQKDVGIEQERLFDVLDLARQAHQKQLEFLQLHGLVQLGLHAVIKNLGTSTRIYPFLQELPPETRKKAEELQKMTLVARGLVAYTEKTAAMLAKEEIKSNKERWFMEMERAVEESKIPADEYWWSHCAGENSQLWEYHVEGDLPILSPDLTGEVDLISQWIVNVAAGLEQLETRKNNEGQNGLGMIANEHTFALIRISELGDRLLRRLKEKRKQLKELIKAEQMQKAAEARALTRDICDGPCQKSLKRDRSGLTGSSNWQWNRCGFSDLNHRCDRHRRRHVLPEDCLECTSPCSKKCCKKCLEGFIEKYGEQNPDKKFFCSAHLPFCIDDD